MSSTATTVISSRQHGFRLSPVPTNRSQLKQIPQQTRESHFRESGPGSRPAMSSATYYGQRSVGYNTGGPSREPYTNMSAPVSRSWAASKDAQTWQEDYSAYSQGQGQQRQQYQPTQQQGPVQIRNTVGHTVSQTVSRQPTRPSTPNSTQSSHPASGASANGDAQSMVTHSLRIPSRISSDGGNLADFSAQVSFMSCKVSVESKESWLTYLAHVSVLV